MTSHIALLKELMKSWNSFIAIDIWPLRGRVPSVHQAARPQRLSSDDPHLVHQHTSPALVRIDSRVPKQSKFSR